ncbi:MAG TPA: lamin tail domain-containing protein [Anaerolineae bacterium]|nr:lamin tail domain-containing protein [Anaerolineae bacterium]
MSQTILLGKTLLVLLLLALLSPFFIADSPQVAQAAPTDLFFSEYIEGSGYNKALEIFNGTGSPVDLSLYTIELYSNGSPTASSLVTLSGTLSSGDVLVVVHSSADSGLLALADLLHSGVTNFNGDDTVGLAKGGTLIDVIGQIGIDPGSRWGSNPSTLDTTLRRRSMIEGGDPNGADAFDPVVEWEGYANDSFDGLGWHTLTEPTPTPTLTDTPVLPVTETPTLTATTSLSVTVTPTLTSTASATPLPMSTPTATFTPIATITPTPTISSTPVITVTPVTPLPSMVVINEVVTDPQQDWSSNNFNGVPGAGTISSIDEFIELLIKTDGLDLTGWTLDLLDGSNVSGDLTAVGAFDVSNYLGTGTFTRTVAGDYLVLGNVTGSGQMSNDILLVLKDHTGQIIDQVEIGSDPQGDGPADGAPDGTAIGGDASGLGNEAVFRYPNGTDTDNDVADFRAGPVSLGVSNDSAVPPPQPVEPLLIGEFVYDGQKPSTEGDEFVEICNPNTYEVPLPGYKIGDEEARGGGESMYNLPAESLQPNDCLVIAKNKADFLNAYAAPAKLYEVGQLTKYTAWGSGSWSLANDGDELVLLGPDDQVMDSVAYRNGDYAGLGLEAGASAPEPYSLQRVWPFDTNSMLQDFVKTKPNPGQLTPLPPPPAEPPAPAVLSNGMFAYWGDLHAHTSYSDGAGPPFYALAMARAAGLHFFSLTDHGWWLSDSEWTRTLSQTVSASVPGRFVALRGLEWTHDTVGHINLLNTGMLVSRNTPQLGDLAGLYGWLAANPHVIAQFNHPDPRYDGNFADFAFHSGAAQVLSLQEIGNNAQGYSTYEPSFLQSNAAGWKVAPTNNSDNHTAGWGADSRARTGIVASVLTEDALFEAIRARRVFATEDENLALALRLDGQWMGSTISKTGRLAANVDAIDPDLEAITLYPYDRNLLLERVDLPAGTVGWETEVEARPGHFFWLKGVQADGDTAYTAPVWLDGVAAPETIVVNEILPAPHAIDWNDDGVLEPQTDEWLELFNPTDYTIGLGGWRLSDSSGSSFHLPLGLTIPAKGYLVLYYQDFKFSLNNSAETVSLFRPDGTMADSFVYTNSPGYDESWCRYPNGSSSWSDDCQPTPGSENRQRNPAQPLKVKIFEAKRLTPGAWVRLTGQVTARPGQLGARIMYIQDQTAGIMIYLPKDHRLNLNLDDKVEVEGNLRLFHGEFEIAVGQRSKVDFIGTGPPLSPLLLETTNMLEPYEGMLVMLQGPAVRFRGSTTFWVDDGSDPAQVVIKRSAGIKKPYMPRGTPVTVVGIVSQYSGATAPTRNDYRLLPRSQTDIVISQPPPTLQPPAYWPAQLPETGLK